MKTNSLFEVFVNSILGKRYYTTFVAPKIETNRKSWIKNKKENYFMLSFDIDEQKDIKNLPWLLDLLNKYKIKAIFAIIGKHVEQHPEIYQQIINNGHELINHTYSHPDNPEFNPNKHFHTLPNEEKFLEIEKCHRVVKKILNYEMTGFRVPHFGYQFTEEIYPLLKKLNYSYSSSTVAIRTKTAGFPYKHDNIWEFPITCCQDHPFCIFDTSHAFRAKIVSHTSKEYIKSFEQLLKSNKNSFINIYQDPQDLKKFNYEKMLILLKKYKLNTVTYQQLTRLLK